jgi:ferredoxin
MKVTVDQDKCISSGQCVSNTSAVFDQRDDDGVVVLLAENVRRAAADCPAAAIFIEE